MLVYCSSNPHTNLVYVKQFGGDIGSADLSKRDEWNSQVEKLLKDVVTKEVDALKIKQGDVLHLKKGFAEVTSVDSRGVLGFAVITVKYLTGELQGKTESRKLNAATRLMVVADKAISSKINALRKLKRKLSGPAEETDGSVVKKAKDLMTGDIIQVSRGLARVDKVDDNYIPKSSNEDKDDPKSRFSKDNKVKVDYTYRTGELKGQKSYGFYSPDSEVTIRPDKSIYQNTDKKEDNKEKSEKAEEPKETPKPKSPASEVKKETPAQSEDAIKSKLARVKARIDEIKAMDDSERGPKEIMELKSLTGISKELKSRLSSTSD